MGLVALGLGVLAVALLTCSILVGSGEIPTSRVVDYLLGHPDAVADPQLQMVINTLRVPRTLTAVLVGAGLGVAGTLLQSATRNPLAETGLLGVNSGAALGVVLGISYAGVESGYGYLVWAFTGAAVASALVLLIARTGGAMVSPLRLVLAGAALGATFRGIMASILLRQPNSYDQYRFWVIGSLSGVDMSIALRMLPAVVIGLLAAVLVARPLSALHLGDDAARALGHRPGVVRVVVAVVVTLLAGASVAMAGPVAFLGLLAPYLARAVAGPRVLAQVALSGLAGVVLMLASDVLARVVIRPYEAPVSVLLAIVGGPALILIVRSRRLMTLRTES
ncbi:iron complex transport system permease protein [Streptoalloteichus tenebrarius]|uniref:Iron complex transport system permease protein n=1 Tax=Streptoalloteichus tenebrarius (strain ATCC 17920 / DSM 40477 / JCM 4838 / CBS 697.72 / NBRC 16177 / NCIMB 11028 / NRRL B-12390 / A12253. 1 / ISP 5477) TaxID=1933 RepID=A0ABT1I092_STRSD|nr:iron ABC transporter permease [Streptoalloteichus tenebrarius]MCP2261207.1 iron complex transport system permease protein [Streptoalloteichus tenebrarius]BFF02931.1 amonabactin ABC transporter permease subunit 2 [Streptoalloteichus tenebrarius]